MSFIASHTLPHRRVTPLRAIAGSIGHGTRKCFPQTFRSFFRRHERIFETL
jgi:hypothetical protein